MSAPVVPVAVPTNNNNNVMNDVAQSVIDGGRIISWVRMIFSVIIALSLFSLAFYLISVPDKYEGQVKATIDTAECKDYMKSITEGSDNNRTTRQATMYKCDLQLKYTTTDNIEYKTPLSTDSETKYFVDNKIDIEYDPKNPKDIQQPAPSTRTIGLGIFASACCMCVGSIIWWWAAQKSSAVAMMTGVDFVASPLLGNRRGFF